MQPLESLLVDLARTELEPTLLQRVFEIQQLMLERARTQLLKLLLEQAHMDRAHGQNSAGALIEFFLLHLDTATHARNHVDVLATQTA